MSGEIEVVGLKQLVKQLKNLEPQLVDDLKALNKELAEDVAGEARNLVPVRSGALLKTIRTGANVRSGIVRAGKKTVAYGAPIHFGWPKRHIKPQPFLYEALDHRRDDVLQAYQKGVAKITEAIQ